MRPQKINTSKQVLVVLCSGTDQEAAVKLGVSIRTVQRMRQKLGVRKKCGGYREGAGRKKIVCEPQYKTNKEIPTERVAERIIRTDRIIGRDIRYSLAMAEAMHYLAPDVERKHNHYIKRGNSIT